MTLSPHCLGSFAMAGPLGVLRPYGTLNSAWLVPGPGAGLPGFL
jgi:hypothetical protein